MFKNKTRNIGYRASLPMDFLVSAIQNGGLFLNGASSNEKKD